MCAYLRYKAGWASLVTTLINSSNVTATVNATDNGFYRYPKAGAVNATEYFIIENRNQSGHDSYVPGSGVCIWHVDESGSNNNEQSTPAQHYECALEQADGARDLEQAVNEGDAQDPFYEGNPSGSFTGEFTDSSSPNARWWDGSNSLVNFHDFGASGSSMTFQVSPVDPNAPTGLTAVPSGPFEIDLSWIKNASNDSVLVAFNTSNLFGTPSGTYSNGAAILGGGTVIYVGNGTAVAHTGLTAATRYYYRAWSILDSGGHSGSTSCTASTRLANDMFADATLMSGSAVEVWGTNVGATMESGEPTPTSASGASVWWKWVAPGAGPVVIDTIGSLFDTTLGVYTGSSVNALTTIASDDNSGGYLASAVTFSAVGGTTYWIGVDGYSSAVGRIRLNLDFVPASLTQGLVAYWPFMSTAPLADASGNGHNIYTLNGTVHIVPSMIGMAIEFFGTGSLSAPSFTVAPANARSICLWVNQPIVQRKTQDIISKHSNPADVEYLIRSAADGKYDFEWTIGGNLYDGSRGGAGGDDGIGLVDPTPGQWDFLVLTYDGATIRFYDNGHLVRSMAATGDIATSNLPLTIGAFAYDHTNPFTGVVDEVRIYNRALSALDVYTLYSAGIPSAALMFLTQPDNQTVSAGDAASFTAVAIGTPAPTYRWQVSTNGGSVWADVPASSPYSGQATSTLTITGVTMSMNGYQYHCVATNPAGSASSNAATLSVNRGAPVITWPTPAAITYPAALSGHQLNATASVPGHFVYSPVAGTVLSGGAHTLHATFTPTDTVDYNGATASVVLTVNKAVPVITWAAPAAITYDTALSAIQLNARSSVTGTFVYSPAVGTVLSAGAHTLYTTFTPTDKADYASVLAIQVVKVNMAVPVITWPAPAAITYGTALSSVQLNATASVPGVMTYVPAAGTVLKAGTQTLKAYFTPTDRTDYTCPMATQTLTVNPASGQAFLEQLFPLVLGRQITPEELSSLSAAMAGGLTRSEVYGKLISSAEYNGRQIDPVIRLYYAALAQGPDCADLRSLSGALNTGALALTAVADELASSARVRQALWQPRQ